jgi:hypothetical protein
LVAVTIARMPALTGWGRLGQAERTALDLLIALPYKELGHSAAGRLGRRLGRREHAMEAAFEDSPKYQRARDALPENLRSIYRDLVADYAFHTLTKYGKGYVAYEILAELVKSGWRRPVQATK